MSDRSTRPRVPPTRLDRSVLSRRFALCLPLVTAVALATSLLAPHGSTVKRPADIAAARTAAEKGDWEEAGQLAEAFLQVHPSNPDALLIAGEAATRAKRFDAALQHYDAVADRAGSDAAVARLCSGDIRLHHGRLTDAEADFREGVRLDPGDGVLRARLVLVLMLSGRRWEARPHLLELVKREQETMEHVGLLGDPARQSSDEDRLRKFRQLAPDDPLSTLGLAKLALLRQDLEQAEPLFRAAAAARPELVEAQVGLGDLIARRGEAGTFLSWHDQVPPAAEGHPQLWFVRGIFSATRGQSEAAARCFWEALRREPNHLAATYQLGQMLSRLGRNREAVLLGERARTLERAVSLIATLHRDPQQIELIDECHRTMLKLGRLWEARAWLRGGMFVEPHAEWVVAARSTLDVPPDQETPQTLPEFDPTTTIDCSAYPLPTWAQPAPSLRETGAGTEFASLQFDTSNAGIDFQFFSDPDPASAGVRMFEFTGGGVGVLDFDQDGRPDLHFTQGCRWPPRPDRHEFLDRLCRNLGGRFGDVTGQSGIFEPLFSQGVACGDVDGDGFQDLYVANIGSNRLFLNNGDGTFSDITLNSGIGSVPPGWTVSAAIADLNGDGLADLFDVNYLEGEDVYELICGQGGVMRACSPTAFEGQPDRLLLNRGDGTFSEVTAIAGIDGPHGTGLGIVVADFEGSGRLSLFVANDAQNNHFYANHTPSPSSPPQFEELAMLNGTAYDRDGHSQACMGVACGDSDLDGRLDLLVTNYVDEYNTLYRQQADGLFVDVSRVAGLVEPSYRMLGFGTQFLDADLDGDEDLVVANGHVDDFTHKGYEYQMRPQLFRNDGGRFSEVTSGEAGAYFDEKRLGRSLARLDWNGDGRDEFVVSHLDAPAVLLSNVTEPHGRSFSLRLAATGSARDAIGAVVTIELGDRRIVKQLTAGDGYAASNERKLVFGLGRAASADRVSIRWPSRRVTNCRDLAAGGEWLIIEGRDAPLLLTSSGTRAAASRFGGPSPERVPQ